MEESGVKFCSEYLKEADEDELRESLLIETFNPSSSHYNIIHITHPSTINNL